MYNDELTTWTRISFFFPHPGENSIFLYSAAYGPVTLGRDRVTKELFITLITRNISNFVRSKVEVPSIIN